MKSSYELAMERLEKQHGRNAPLSDAQKKDIAEIENQAKARAAEIEIMMAKDLDAARASGDPAKIQEAERRKVEELARIRARAEDDKERVRKAGAGGA